MEFQYLLVQWSDILLKADFFPIELKWFVTRLGGYHDDEWSLVLARDRVGSWTRRMIGLRVSSMYKIQFTIIAWVQLYQLVRGLYTSKGFTFVLHRFATFIERIHLIRGFQVILDKAKSAQKMYRERFQSSKSYWCYFITGILFLSTSIKTLIKLKYRLQWKR